LPCSFVDEGGRRCVNTRNANIQDQDSEGTALNYGGFVSDFADQVQIFWLPEFDKDLRSLDDTLERTQLQSLSVRDSENAKLNATWSIHHRNVEQLYRALPNLKTYNFFTCFICLRGIPVEVLSCWHSICAACLHMCGEVDTHSDTRAVILLIYSYVLHHTPV
jgi:hypothetical protein